jgi:hypothetical protein
MKKVWKVLFGNESPLIAAIFMALISFLIPLTIDIFAKADNVASWYEYNWMVEASYKFLYLQERNVWLMWLGPVLSAAVSIYYVWKNGGLGKGAGDKTPGRFYALCWIGTALICLTGLLKTYGGHEYTKIVTPQEFWQLKGNTAATDSLFIK